jgi:selenocysteine lyase/cysteine desulfurase
VNLAAAAGLAAGLAWALEHERAMRCAITLAERLASEINERPGVQLVGNARGPRIATVSMRPHGVDLERLEEHFAQRGLCVRAGQHCAPMALDALGAPDGTLRVSFGPGNREQDLSAFLEALDALG